ncbi:MAG: PA14 domain-containing protein, partial [Microcoleaceae cyanobacterium]
MGWSWGKKQKSKNKLKNGNVKQQKKPRSKTFILEEIISPSGGFCPIPIDDSFVSTWLLDSFTQEELFAAILGNNPPIDITNIDIENLFQDYFEKVETYFIENPTVADGFDLEDLSTWPTLEALINPGQPGVEIPDVGGVVDTLPPPVTVPIDPPRNNHNKDYDFPLENQPLVGVIDTGFSANNPDLDYSRITLGGDRLDNDNNPLLASGEGNEHGSHVLGIIGATQNNGIGIDGINDDAPLWLGRAIGSGEWADSLREFVDDFRQSGKKNAIANLSLDLTQADKNGIITTRYELTPEERVALEYARQNGVLIVVAAGNDGDVMSVLGQASQEFDNLITVGAADGENRAAYSSYGHGLDILAPGGTESNPLFSTVGNGLGTMAGTSVASAQVTGAASLVWAANPDLSYRQVVEILKSTAEDVQAPGWDEETGAGLLDIDGAVELAKVTLPQEYEVASIITPESWSGAGAVTPGERAVATEFMGKYYKWSPYVIQSGDTLSGIAYRTMGGGTAPYYNFIAQRNGIANPNYIYPGQNILIPQQVAAPTPPAPPPIIQPIQFTEEIDPIAKEAIEEVYQQQKAKLGEATSQPVDLGNGFLKQNFEGGYIIWNGNKAIAYITGPGTPTTPKNEPLGLSQVGFDGQSTHQTYINTFNRNGGSEKLGFPINNVHPWEEGYTQDFDWGSEGRGAIMKAHGEDNSYWVGGKIWDKFLDIGGAGYLGYPTTDAVSVSGGLDNSGGKVQHFRGAEGIATKIWLSQHGAHPTWGAIGGRYDSMGGPGSWLGFPTSAEHGIGDGWVKQDFEGGYMLWHPQQGTTVYNTTIIDTLPPDSGNGSTGEWNVQFWNNKNLSGTPAWTRTDPPGELRFHAGTGAPPDTRGVSENNFSVRWETASDFEGGFYHFKTKADDGMRIYVDGVLVNQKWGAVNAWEQHDAYIAIPEGKHDIRIDYFEAGGVAGITSLWEPTEFLAGYTGDFRPVGFDGTSVHGTFVGTYQRNGAIEELGYPINNVHPWENGYIQDFEGGAAGRGGIMKANGESNSYWVGGKIWDKFFGIGGARYLGYPTTDAIPVPGGLDNSGGKVQHFRGAEGIASKIWLSQHGAHPTWGAIGNKYDKLSGPSSWLGFPTSGEYFIKGGWIKQDFEGGYILAHPNHAPIAYDTKAIDTLPPDSGNSSTSNWHAQYWDNKGLTGSPDWSQYEDMSDLRFHAGGGAPVGTRGIEADTFGGRWITTSYFDGGIYNFINRADDGVRVYVDGQLIIDKWKDSPFEEKRAYAAIEPGYHQVMVEYYDNRFSAANHLRWEQPNTPDQWAVEYFRGKDLNPDNLAGHRGGGTDFINKLWGSGTEPGIPVGNDNFSDRWTTTRYFDEPGVYEFNSQADDGIRVWVDDKLVIDKWHDQGFITNKALVSLDEGYHQIRVEHYENKWSSALDFDWKKVAGQPNGNDGWLEPWAVEYFNNPDLQGAPVLTRLENPVGEGGMTVPDLDGGFNSDWGKGSPDASVNSDNFSSRMTTHRYLEEGTYKFNLKGDDGIRVYINGEKVIDRWDNPPFGTPHAEEIILPEGLHRIEVEHSENYGLAYAGLDWNFLEKQSDLQPGATTTGENQPEILATYEDLVAEFGASAIGVPITPLTTEYDSPQPPPGGFAPTVVFTTGQIQEFRGTNGRGAILKANNSPATYVFGKLWDAFQNMGGTKTLGYPLSSQNDLANGASELELENGKLFWAPGMTNPTYYEYAQAEPKTLTIPADAW